MLFCPICGVDRPREMHLDWCDYEGPEPDPDDYEDDEEDDDGHR